MPRHSDAAAAAAGGADNYTQRDNATLLQRALCSIDVHAGC